MPDPHAAEGDGRQITVSGLPRCITKRWKPEVWHDEDGWRTDQSVQCLTCANVWTDNLAEGVTWPEALAAALTTPPASRGES